MDHIGIDRHKMESQIYLLAEGGEVIEQRIRTAPERFAAVLGSRPRARILAYRACVPSPASAPSPPPPSFAAVEDAQRFRHAHQLEAYLGLVPREYR